MEKTLIATKGAYGERLDKFIHTKLSFISRTRIHNLVEEGKIRVNGKLKKPSYRLKIKDQIHLIFEKEKVLLKPYQFAVKIIYEDDAIIVVDKPQGLVVHPPNIKFQQSLINALIYMEKELSTLNPKRPGVVHRLDKETSGVMVLAKTNSAHLNLVNQFKKRIVKKEYHAICWGKIKKEKLMINLPLARDSKNRLRMKISFLRAKSALTHLSVLERLNDATFLSLEPHTGRMHQIRVHLKFLGYPIVGDKKYGIKDKYEELFLHASKLGFHHPKERNFLRFESVLPSRFKEFITERKNV